MLSIGPTGNLIEGSIFDVSRGAVERQLKFYDALLYIKWNPNKRSKMGCWEVRRRPEKKTAVRQTSFQSGYICTLEYKELDLIAHVIDAPILTYGLVGKIRDMDCWQDKNWADNLDKKAADFKRRAEEYADREMRYAIKHDRRVLKEFKDLVATGKNPARVFQLMSKLSRD